MNLWDALPRPGYLDEGPAKRTELCPACGAYWDCGCPNLRNGLPIRFEGYVNGGVTVTYEAVQDPIPNNLTDYSRPGYFSVSQATVQIDDFGPPTA